MGSIICKQDTRIWMELPIFVTEKTSDSQDRLINLCKMGSIICKQDTRIWMELPIFVTEKNN